ncbi:protein Daple-like isoform X2 [Ruditapes philippinarum]|uniref:protein Daple-like isoform X2 n=1 Tax=Ruditapes philippinarum TaxID=129788 RepID=UPI00295AEC8F|nr:protein Daple-like isoform X2 [Ruditapes philippinarum]
MTSHLNSEMASLITEDDHVFDVIEKLRIGRRPAATIISQARQQYAKLRTELQLYKDEIIQIKKVKNAKVSKEEQVQEQLSSTEIYKMMEASARHTAENERLREELKSANSEIELLSKHIDDLKQQIECLRPENFREKNMQDTVNGSDNSVEDVQTKVNDSHDNENIVENAMLATEKNVSDNDKTLHVDDNTHKESDLIYKEKESQNIVQAVHSKTNGLDGLEKGFQDNTNDIQDKEEMVLNRAEEDLNDEKNSMNDKEKDLYHKGNDAKNWPGILQEKEKGVHESVHDLDNNLMTLKEEMSKLSEENRRLESKITNLNQDIKLQQKITTDKERHVQALEDDLHNLTDENNKLKHENTHLKTENDKLNQHRKENDEEKHTAVVSVSSMAEENKNLRSENEHWRGELKHANEKTQRLTRRINEMTVKSETSREDDVVKREMEQLRVENIRLKHDLKKLSQMVEKAKKDREEQRGYDERIYRDEQLPRLDSFNKNETHELQEENRRLRHDVKQLKQDVAYAKHDRDQQRKQEEISYKQVVRYKQENNLLVKEKERLKDEKVILERDLQKARDKLELILGERNKEKDNHHAMEFRGNGYSKDYGFPVGQYMQSERKLKATEDRLQRLFEEKSRDEQNVSQYKEDYYRLKKELDKLERVNVRLESDLKRAIQQHDHEDRGRLKSSSAKSIEQEYSEHLGKERLHRSSRGLDSESRATKDTMRKLSESSYDKRENDSERQRFEDFRRTIEKQKNQIKMLSEENRKLQNDVHEVRNRLSTLAGHKMTKDNPNIADLSDNYRPTNIAEQFREVYDNEWTQAYEELDQHYRNDETRIIDSLLSILKNIEAFCVEVSSHQFASLKSAIENELTYPKYKLENGTVMAGKHRAEMSSSQKDIEDKFLKDLRKSLGILSTGPLAQIFHEVHMKKQLGAEFSSAGLKTFIVQSVKLVWMMKMQTPPMAFIWAEPKQNVDKNRFTFYTRRGDVIKQCIWPALALHKNGPLMSKGIVQAV